MKKKNYHHGNLKEELLSIAFKFIHQEDINKLTLKVLADATNTSRSAIYRHFRSKDELIKAIIEKGFDEFDNVIVPILTNKEESIDQRFFTASHRYIEWVRANPSLYRLLFGKKYAYIREEFITIKSENCKAFVSLRELLEEGQEKHLIQEGDSMNQAIIIWSSLHGLATLIIDCFKDIEDIYEVLITQTVQTLAAGLRV